MTPAASRRKGATAEIELLRILLDAGKRAARVRLAGVEDEGDIHVFSDNGTLTVIEAKAATSTRLPEWLRELDREVANAAKHRPGVTVKGCLAIRLRGGRWVTVAPLEVE